MADIKKPRQKEFTTTKGNKFTFQSVPNSTYLEMTDESIKPDGNPAISKLYPKLLEHVVVQPAGLSVDDFNDFGELREVCEAALTFQQK